LVVVEGNAVVVVVVVVEVVVRKRLSAKKVQDYIKSKSIF
jgi:hypothetical protein